MKSYIIRIELEESNPLIWRRVIMPAGATFNRLNDIIQNVTNFQSGYPYGDYHLYEFDLREENLIVTNDVGGLDGFYEFLEAYRDSKHPDHQEIKAWADAQYFKEYDPEWINSYISCSGMQYKKNEWDKINHENYRVIEDKYRK